MNSKHLIQRARHSYCVNCSGIMHAPSAYLLLRLCTVLYSGVEITTYIPYDDKTRVAAKTENRFSQSRKLQPLRFNFEFRWHAIIQVLFDWWMSDYLSFILIWFWIQNLCIMKVIRKILSSWIMGFVATTLKIFLMFVYPNGCRWILAHPFSQPCIATNTLKL